MSKFDWSQLFDEDGHCMPCFRLNIRGFLDAWRCADGAEAFHESLQVLKTLNDMHDIAAGRDCCALTRGCFDRLATQVDLSGVTYEADAFGRATERCWLATQKACRTRSAEIAARQVKTGAILASYVHSWFPHNCPSRDTFVAFCKRFGVAERYLRILTGETDWRELARAEIGNTKIKAHWLEIIRHRLADEPPARPDRVRGKKKKVDELGCIVHAVQKTNSARAHKEKPTCTSRPFTAAELEEEHRRLHAVETQQPKREYSFFGEIE